MTWSTTFSSFFFFNDTATTEIYTLSLHDALPISKAHDNPCPHPSSARRAFAHPTHSPSRRGRSEEHTSELQSHSDLVCRLLLEKKKNKTTIQGKTLLSKLTDTSQRGQRCLVIA